jgi:hypothetical protein
MSRHAGFVFDRTGGWEFQFQGGCEIAAAALPS